MYNRVGDLLTGPSPRGMDQFPVELGEDGLLHIDTGSRIDGPEPGVLRIDEPARGPSCATEAHE